MLNVQQKFKKSFLAAILIIFATHNSSSCAVVEKPNLTPLFVLGGAGVAALVAGSLLHPENLYNLLEEKAIDSWIEKNDLNVFGEPKDTVYQDDVTGPLEEGQSRIDYIKAKFIDEDVKPWRSGFVRMLDGIRSLHRRAGLLTFTGISLVCLSVIISCFVQTKYNDAVFQEEIGKNTELENQFFFKIGSAVADGVTKGLASNNAQ